MISTDNFYLPSMWPLSSLRFKKSVIEKLNNSLCSVVLTSYGYVKIKLFIATFMMHDSLLNFHSVILNTLYKIHENK